MKNALEFNIKGIKCDVCDFKDEKASFEEYEKWLNKPCPKCGANLLTQEDLDNTMMIISFTEMMNNILSQSNDNEERVTMEVKMNGTGSIDFEMQ